MSDEGVNIINGSGSPIPSQMRSRSASPNSMATTTSDKVEPRKKFQNGWSKEQEKLNDTAKEYQDIID